MRVLVLRAEPEASETAARLRAAGHEALVAPLFRIEYAPPPDGFATPRAIAFTSRNAVRAVMRWPLVRDWRDSPVFAVGAETAAEAHASGFTEIRLGPGNAAGLADAIAAEAASLNGTILYPAAHDRAFDLAGRLRETGVAVREIEAYRMVGAERLDPAAVDAIAARRIDAVLFFSRRSAEVFADLAPTAGLKNFGGISLYALSASIAEPLRALHPAAIHIAPRARVDSLFSILLPAR